MTLIKTGRERKGGAQMGVGYKAACSCTANANSSSINSTPFMIIPSWNHWRVSHHLICQDFSWTWLGALCELTLHLICCSGLDQMLQLLALTKLKLLVLAQVCVVYYYKPINHILYKCQINIGVWLIMSHGGEDHYSSFFLNSIQYWSHQSLSSVPRWSKIYSQR